MSTRRTRREEVFKEEWSTPDPDNSGGEFSIVPETGDLLVFVTIGSEDPPTAATQPWGHTVKRGDTYKVDVEDQATLYWKAKHKDSVIVVYTFGGHP